MQTVNRELTAGEVISNGFGLFTRHFLTLAIPLFFGAIATAIIQLIYTIQLTPLTNQLLYYQGIVNETNVGEVLGVALQVLGYSILETFILWIVSIYFLAVAVKAAYDVSTGKQVSLMQSFTLGASKLPSLLVSSFLVGIIIGIGLILLVVPGIIFLIMFAMFIPAIILENGGGLDSLSRSRQLVSHRWGQVFIVGLAAILISLVLGFIFDLFLSWLDNYQHAVVQPFYAIISNAITIAFLVTLYQSLIAKEKGPEQWGSTPVPPPAQVAYCTGCGAALPQGATVCPKCGTPRHGSSSAAQR